MVRQRGLQNGNWGHSATLWPCITRSQIGQRTLIIGNSGLGLGTFPRLFRTACRFFPAARSGFAVGGILAGGGRLGGLLVGLGGGLVRLAAVVGLVEARTLEDDRRASAEGPPQLLLAALRALAQRLVRHRMKIVEIVVAGVALVFV